MEKTLIRLLEESAEKWPERALMLEKKSDTFATSTYAKIRDQARYFGRALMELGLKKGERIALLSEGRNAWFISELGILYNGAINVPISVKIEEPNELFFRIHHSGSRFVIVSANHFSKVEAIVDKLPELEKIISLDKQSHSESSPVADRVLFYDDLLARGESLLADDFSSFQNVWESVKESDPCNIVYTSGTTADPKGIILSHRNYTSNVEQASRMFGIPDWSDKNSLLILPWDHSFAHTAGIYTLMYNGASMASVQVGKTMMETLKNIPINIKDVKPTYLLSVPALAQNFRKNIEKGIAQKGKFIEKLFQFALRNAYAYQGEGWNRGKGFRKLRAPLHALFKKIIFSKIQDNFGGRLEFFVGGGALLDIELQRFFYAIGIPMFQGYGLSEASPIISANVPHRHKLGSSGSIVPDLEIQILDDQGNNLPAGEKGEIVVKGENVMLGYWKNEEATAKTIVDGWLYTGDLGYMDKDGFLYVLGREKSLLISSDGEKYSPEGIEEALAAGSYFIDQVMLHNNQSPYTVALFYLNKEQIQRFMKEEGLQADKEKDLSRVLDKIQGEVNAYKSGGEHAGIFPGKWLPAAIGILSEGFTEENRFLNSTLKMVRGKITEHYQDSMDFLHTADGKNINNERNRKALIEFLQR